MSAAAWRSHPWLAPRVLVPLAAVLVAVQLPFLHWALRGAAEVNAAVPYEDKFDRASIGEAWWSNGGHWRLVKGELYSPGVGNNPLWLKARLPADVRIEFDVRSEGADGDVKWEAFGDGRNHSTGYVFLFGAWHNRESRICKLDEHAFTAEEMRAQLAGLARPFPRRLEGMDRILDAVRDPFVRWGARHDLERLEKGTFYGEETPFVVKRMDLKAEKGRRYHMRVIKQGRLVRWDVDGSVALEMNDPAPLSGKGHDRFGFSSWANDTYFDNLVVAPL
ncbi:MAG: hypothetical protein E6J78_13025 [Deltaproteobacteria bacterium]|nr:MAG: hypothetical protein E6J78_13025 [Deltaproteobacteria bacterium]